MTAGLLEDKMKAVFAGIFLLLITNSNALERGRDYMKDKICQEFKTLGKDKFRSVTIVLNSRKYSNATFQEVKSIVNEIVALAEKCCAEGADPECYNTESLALSAKSCEANTPFPHHPGTAECCKHEGLERKLCLAALKHPPKEFFTYVEPSNEEVCQAFRRDPQDFADRFLHEYSSDHSQTPLTLLLASTTNYLSMVGTCCIHAQPTACFLKERLQRKSLQTLTDLSNKACSRYVLFGKEKTRLSYLIRYTQKSPNASFEDIATLAEDASEILSKCCDASLEEDCIQKEVLQHKAKICNKLSAADQRIHQCCHSGTDEMKQYLCIYSLPWAESPQPSEVPAISDEVLCSDRRKQEFDHYVHEVARRYTRTPEALITTLYEVSQKVVNGCCSAVDPSACFAVERPQNRAKAFALLAKGNKLCGEYTDLLFTDFKKMLRESYQKALPTATEDAISGLVEQRAKFASTCCHLNAPPSYCGLQIKTETPQACTQDICEAHK